MINRKWLIAALALIGGGGLAGSLGVLPAVGQASPPSSAVILGGSAPIINSGAAAVPFAYVACPAGGFATLDITLTERTGGGIASGSGYSDFNCSGQVETVRVPVTATNKPFKKGTAFGQASLFFCGPSGCDQATASGSVKLHR